MSDALATDLARDLTRPEAYPQDPSGACGIEAVQTHISHVFLTRERVYKLRKPVALPFLDFSTRARRNADCLREVALNRRLAPDVYLGVAPLVRAAGGWQVGPLAEALAAPHRGGEVPEHCVVMRRLPAGCDGLSLLELGKLTAVHVAAVAHVLAAFHAAHGLGAPAPWSPAAWQQRVRRPVLECFAPLRTQVVELAAPEVERVEAREAARFDEMQPRFEERRQAGRAVDGHGDVHLQHVWFERGAGEPLLIDCIEFGDDLRRIDAASDVAFLAMDLRYRGRPDLAERFLREYAAERDDFGLYGVVDYYAAYRSLVRAKVAALAAGDAAIAEAQRAAARGSARRHLELAGQLFEAPRPGVLVVLCGVVGSGKSTLARALADQLQGAVVSSDRTRKHLFDLAATERRGALLAGIYSRAHSDRVYAGLVERAGPVLRSGRAVILDAAFAGAARRRRVLDWARKQGLRPLLVEARCDAEVALERLARREAEGRDPSDAGPALHAWSVQRFETPDEWPAEDRVVVRTDAADWSERIAAIAANLR